MYDPSIGRWNGVDDKVMEYLRTSPYVFVLNSPINFMDPDGETVVPQNLSPEQKAKYQERMNRLNELGKQSPTIRRVVDKANSEDVMIHLYTFKDDRSDNTTTKSKHYPYAQSLEKTWSRIPDASGMTITEDFATADVIISDDKLTPENEGGDPGEFRADLTLLDELSHAVSDANRGDKAKTAFDHYNLFSNLSGELGNLGEWGVYVKGQVNKKKTDAQEELVDKYLDETKQDAATFDEALKYYQKKYEKK